ncbi:MULTISPECIES: ABC transporter substrate-binding protein [Pseudomonas]|uniref:ABC transporter substrate-binding protein n=1 Tax=Pseudomonas TaxID=286 RepID=UPI000F6CBA4F|nr:MULTISPECIES: ABC transporter substrate-binding protein [Pseudomonas]AZF15553.1 Taurine-binding periplasmic protein TauA [Pseudomonas sp. R3-18-08]AZF26196.1 Taurine-binding periplasmic protein TauA [Pseudomonas sp. R2-60-08W]AZF31562.1 Taurine-binding periplasmic protein TauA [Pseudomonas sp. R4-35-07]AZF36838.1 Taurine-binding periplasmic protein TauA [Pseudomonas sp. R4-39-08]AZF52505.1 Taurine-binding periplasmic protein TauA [Pseudomonas sp. R4-34-07]
MLRSFRKKGCRPALSACFASITCALLAGPACAQTEQDKVTLAIQYGYAYLPVTVADKLGMFQAHAKAHGQAQTTFEIKRISGSPAINDALLSGNVDIGGYGLSGTLVAWSKTRTSLDVRVLCGLVAGDNGLFVNDPSIKSIADFKPDDKIAVSSPSGQQALLLQMAAERQFGPDGVHRLDNLMVSLPHPDATSSLLNRTGVKAYIGPNPYSYQLSQDPRVSKLFDFSTELNLQMTSGVLTSTGRFVKKNPELSAAVVAAISEANDYIRKEPRKAAELFLASESSSLSVDQVEAMLRQVSGEWSVQPHGVMALADFMVRSGALKTAPSDWRQVFFAPVSEGEGS